MPTLTVTFPASPCMIGGTDWMTVTISWRESGVANWVTMALLTAISSRPRTAPTRIVARRESRMVLPKMLPKP